MTALERHLDDYLAVRRGLGFKLTHEQRMLTRFVAFLDDAGEPTITIDLALHWATMPTGVGHAYLAQRMRAVRGFARYLRGIDPHTQVPPLELLPARKDRPTPHIYTPAEIALLMAAARTLRPALRAATMETLIGLLACSGLRDGEAFALDRTDIDRANRLLRIRDSKFGKSREVLIHDSALAALDAYLARRDQLRPGGDRACVFVSSWGARLSHQSVHHSFDQIRRASGLTGPSPDRQPRLHDLRHTYSVNTLLGWYRAGEDVAAKLPLLSTYLGHVDPAATYWYLSAVPELLGLAVSRLEGRGSGDTASERELALLLREQERVRHWRAGAPDDPLFPSSRGRALSRDAVALIVTRHTQSATDACPTLAAKTVSPHVLRHTTGMNLLHAGVDTSVIALWFGHESTEATQIYLHADMAIKQRALDRTTPIGVKPGRYRPADALGL